jgi:glycosyltransferase involved in cell wall biosynthesis
MRQLFVVHGPAYGGGIGQFARLREPMARRGWDLSGIAPARSHSAQRLREEGLDMHEIELHRLRRTPNPRTQLEFARGLRAEIAEIRRVIRDNDIDVVQVHGDTNPHGAIAAHLEGRAVVWQLFDTVTPPPARRVTMPFVTRIADVMTTWGRQLGLDYPGTSSLGDRWIPVFPPVDGDVFYAVDPARRAAARERMGVSDDEVVVGQAGNFNPTKGHANLVESVAIVRRSHAELVARIYGAYSPAHPGLKEEVRAKAEALGLDEHVVGLADGGKDIPVLMPGFDVLALSSVRRSEGMPTVILEAMACGLPVVATNVGAVRELVADGETGFVVEPEDPAAFAVALEKVVADAKLRARLGEAGRARFEREFSLEVLADIHVRAYERAREHRAQR